MSSCFLAIFGSGFSSKILKEEKKDFITAPFLQLCDIETLIVFIPMYDIYQSFGMHEFTHLRHQ